MSSDSTPITGRSCLAPSTCVWQRGCTRPVHLLLSRTTAHVTLRLTLELLHALGRRFRIHGSLYGLRIVESEESLLYSYHRHRRYDPVASPRACRRSCKTLPTNVASSKTNFATDSPGLLARLWNLNRSGAGLKCFVSVSTNTAYDFSPGFVEDSRFRSVLLVAAPITDRRTARFFSAASIPFATKKCSSRSTYCGQSSLLPSNSSTRRIPDIPTSSPKCRISVRLLKLPDLPVRVHSVYIAIQK